MGKSEFYPSLKRTDLAPGDRVMITAWSNRGRTGTIVRRSGLPNMNRHWLIELAGASPTVSWRGRIIVGEWILRKIEPSNGA